MTTDILIAGLVSLAVAAASPFAILPALHRWQVMDVPNHRSAHTAVTPRGGGLAVLLALCTGTLVGWAFGIPMGAASASILVVTLVLGGLGFVEDSLGLSVRVRLLLQYLPSMALAAFLLPHFDVPAAWALAIGLAGVYAVNATNFMDGVNGISGFHGVLLGLYVIVLAITSESDQSTAFVFIGVLIVAAFAGFLPWNFPKARLFLGDVGSYTLGALFYGAALLTWLTYHSLLLSVAPLLIYSADVVSTLAIRFYRGDSLTQAHSDHTYQHIRRQTNSHGFSALYAAGATAVVMVIALLSHTGMIATLIAWLLALLVAASYLVVGRRVVNPAHKLNEAGK